MPEQVQVPMLGAVRWMSVVDKLGAVARVDRVVRRTVVKRNHRVSANPALDQRTSAACRVGKRKQPGACAIERGRQRLTIKARPLSMRKSHYRHSMSHTRASRPRLLATAYGGAGTALGLGFVLPGNTLLGAAGTGGSARRFFGPAPGAGAGGSEGWARQCRSGDDCRGEDFGAVAGEFVPGGVLGMGCKSREITSPDASAGGHASNSRSECDAWDGQDAG
jgi:hypothetical protein